MRSRTPNLRKGAGNLAAFLGDVFSWKSFTGYRQRPEAFIVGSAANVARLTHPEWRAKLGRNDGKFSLVFLVLLLPLPITFAFAGSDRLGDATTLAVTVLVWGIILGVGDYAESNAWRTQQQVIVFFVFTACEVGAVVALSHVAVAHHRHISGILWGVTLAGALDVGASLVTLIVRLRNGRPFGGMLEDDWTRVRRRGLAPPS